MKDLTKIITTVLMVLIMVSLVQAAMLVHEWKFEDDVLDTSGSGNHGTITGAPGYVDGAWGRGISMVAGDAVDNVAANLGGVNLANRDISINFWLNLGATPANLSYIGGIGGRADNGLGTARGTLNFASGFYYWGNVEDADSLHAYIADGGWHMYTVALDYDGAGNVTYSFYVDGDGSFYPPVTVARNTFDALNAVGIGGTSLWGSTWAGSMDEFTIWSGAITPAGATSLYETNTIPEPTTMMLLGLGGLTLLRRKYS